MLTFWDLRSSAERKDRAPAVVADGGLGTVLQERVCETNRGISEFDISPEGADGKA